MVVCLAAIGQSECRKRSEANIVSLESVRPPKSRLGTTATTRLQPVMRLLTSKFLVLKCTGYTTDKCLRDWIQNYYLMTMVLAGTTAVSKSVRRYQVVVYSGFSVPRFACERTDIAKPEPVLMPIRLHPRLCAPKSGGDHASCASSFWPMGR